MPAGFILFFILFRFFYGQAVSGYNLLVRHFYDVQEMFSGGVGSGSVAGQLFQEGEKGVADD